MPLKYYRFCIAGTNSGVGKTTITLGLMRALKRRGLKVAPFKCGPDYIDPSYHRQAAGAESVNLDTWMIPPEGLRNSFARNSDDADVAVVEGVMGLYDGASASSPDGSTADCAEKLGIPVVLLVNARGIAGSIAALVKGFRDFSKNIKICGVIANNVGSESHANLLKDALAANGLPPLLGALPHDEDWSLPERHLGLTPFCENSKTSAWFETLAEAAEKHIAIDRLLELSMSIRQEEGRIPRTVFPSPSSRIAMARDDAFHFYYADNIYNLRMAGFEIVEFSPLNDNKIPEKTDLLYLGGGFPEIFAGQLADNCEIRNSIKKFAEAGGRIYAECGGMMFLCRNLRNSQGREFPMCGVLPASTFMKDRMRALGYREVTVLHDMPFCKAGTVMRGHEFHWSDFTPDEPLAPLYKASNSRGEVSDSGVIHNSVTASYIHLHFESNPTAILNMLYSIRVKI
jgi:cobyrinic acid a,c-diamide synthase